MKNPDDPIGNSTRNVPNCSAVRQANASPSTPIKVGDIWGLGVTLFGQQFAIVMVRALRLEVVED